MAVTIESLKAVSYLNTEHLDGRVVKLMPLWDDESWHFWVDTPDGLVEGKMVDTVEGDYVAKTAAGQSDLFIPFIHLMWQRASWPEICPLISAISDDFRNMGTSIAKLRHFFDCRGRLPRGAAPRFASTELEYLVILARTVFDLLQEMISITWKRRVLLLDEAAEKRRRSGPCPMASLGSCFVTSSKLERQMKSRASMGYRGRWPNNARIWHPFPVTRYPRQCCARRDGFRPYL